MDEIVIDKPGAEACKALGLKEHDVLATRTYDDGRVVIVTTDGRKLTWRKADTTETGETGEQPAPRKGKVSR